MWFCYEFEKLAVDMAGGRRGWTRVPTRSEN
jgi:hypothetical protein